MRHLRPRPRLLRLVAPLALAAAACASLVAVTTGPAEAAASPTRAAAPAANVATPGNFTGYGFDQCLAPSQAAMDAWLTDSPFWAVGIYISGASRACRNQPNLTPTWVSTQLANGWRLLPITLGPQASCSTRFPRYGNDPTINPSATNTYAAARKMGRVEAQRAVDAATALGLAPTSTLWYDIEAFSTSNKACRESALWFLSSWTKQLHKLDFVSGVYSSAASGIKLLDDARLAPKPGYASPDRIWVADWNGHADTASTYFSADGWLPGGRMHQYQGGHNETWGGVTINIDRNWLDLGTGSLAKAAPKRCGGVQVDFASYPRLAVGATGDRVTALQCLLTERKYYAGKLDGVMAGGTVDAVRAFRADHGLPAGRAASKAVWVSLHTQGRTKLVKFGAAGEVVRRLQRALNSAADEKLAVTGVFEKTTTAAVQRYQARRGLKQTGVVTPSLWSLLQSGKL